MSGDEGLLTRRIRQRDRSHREAVDGLSLKNLEHAAEDIIHDQGGTGGQRHPIAGTGSAIDPASVGRAEEVLDPWACLRDHHIVLHRSEPLGAVPLQTAIVLLRRRRQHLDEHGRVRQNVVGLDGECPTHDTDIWIHVAFAHADSHTLVRAGQYIHVLQARSPAIG